MKAIRKFSLLVLSALLMFTGCKPDNPPVDGEATLKLSSNKATMAPDGKDRVTFTVEYIKGSTVNVTSEAVITNKETGQAVVGGFFTASEPGVYKFIATYTDPETSEEFTSNELEITVSSSTLEVDKNTLVAGGVDKAVFKVMYNDKDVSDNSYLVNETTGEQLLPGEMEIYSTLYAGEFRIHAVYLTTLGNVKTNSVDITVENAEINNLRLIPSSGRVRSGETVDFKVMLEDNDVTSQAQIKNVATGDYLTDAKYTYSGSDKFVDFVAEYEGVASEPISVGTGNFYKRGVGFRFTQIQCTYCPAMAKSFEKAMQTRPDRLVQAAIHAQDALAISNLNDIFEYAYVDGYPTAYINGLSIYTDVLIGGQVSSNDIVSKIRSFESKVPRAGISINSHINGNNLDADINVTAAVDGEYFLGVMLLENGITGYNQSGTSQGSKYVHDHTLIELPTSFVGDSIGTLTENEQKTVTYNFDINKLGAKIENCEILCYVIYIIENTPGKPEYNFTNALVVPAGEYKGYTFE